MEFPKNNIELDSIFKNGSEPVIDEFEGEYWVSMLTGMIPNFRWVGHRKRFFDEEGKKVGKNIILLNSTFGYFKVEKGKCDDLNNLNVMILNYGEKRNFLTRSVRDKIRRIEDNIFLGRYYNVMDGSYYFKGYFSLIKR